MLHYRIYGSGTPLVFLHGALVSSNMWQEQINFFQNKFKIITIDLPEHGNSNESLDAYTIENISNIVIDTLKRLDVKSIHLCGHSLGGMVAQAIAISNPQLINNLILAETSYGTKDTINNKIGSAFASLYLKLITQEKLIKLSANNYGKYNKKTKDFLLNEMSKYTIYQSRKIMSAPLNYSSFDYLNQIKMRTLLIVGKYNKQTHTQAKIMKTLIPNSEFKSIPEAHHLVNIDNPNAFNEALKTFLN